MRAAVRVARALEPAPRRDDLRAVVFRADVFRADVFRPAAFRPAVFRPVAFRPDAFRAALRPPRLAADLRRPPVFERADADERPPRLDELFLRPPLRPDFDFVLAMKILSICANGRAPAQSKATGNAQRMFRAPQESNIFSCGQRNCFRMFAGQRTHRGATLQRQHRSSGNKGAEADGAAGKRYTDDNKNRCPVMFLGEDRRDNRDKGGDRECRSGEVEGYERPPDQQHAMPNFWHFQPEVGADSTLSI